MEAFSYSVSHDLRSPLRTIEGFSQIILENYSDKIDERGQDYLQRTRNAVMRMEKLIDDILRLSRLSRVSMIHEMVDLSGLAQSVVAGLREREPDRKVEVAIQPGLTIAGDRELLRAAMENLIGNAWKFTGKKEDARIEVGGLPDDGEVIFYVRDNGAGFNKAYADKLFKPFQRLHSEKEFPGTGIGLALVHRIASRHGGGVRAESEPGQGATFYLSLPAKGGAYDRTEDSARRG
jgi:light-regulated signal transduction histidine kinase (bacteriophytochrome)